MKPNMVPLVPRSRYAQTGRDTDHAGTGSRSPVENVARCQRKSQGSDARMRYLSRASRSADVGR
eukprot:2349856-Rhodomonas_salina.1